MGKVKPSGEENKKLGRKKTALSGRKAVLRQVVSLFDDRLDRFGGEFARLHSVGEGERQIAVRALYFDGRSVLLDLRRFIVYFDRMKVNAMDTHTVFFEKSFSLFQKDLSGS